MRSSPPARIGARAGARRSFVLQGRVPASSTGSGSCGTCQPPDRAASRVRKGVVDRSARPGSSQDMSHVEHVRHGIVRSPPVATFHEQPSPGTHPTLVEPRVLAASLHALDDGLRPRASTLVHPEDPHQACCWFPLTAHQQAAPLPSPKPGPDEQRHGPKADQRAGALCDRHASPSRLAALRCADSDENDGLAPEHRVAPGETDLPTLLHPRATTARSPRCRHARASRRGRETSLRRPQRRDVELRHRERDLHRTGRTLGVVAAAEELGLPPGTTCHERP